MTKAMKALKSFVYSSKSLSYVVNRVIDWKILNLSPRSHSLGVTYLNNKLTDGAGAQLQRIYGIYAISRFLNVPYIHSPLISLDYQGLNALENNSSDQEIVPKYNKVFQIHSDMELPKDFTVHEIHNFNLRIFEQLRKEAEASKTFILARILLPYGVTDSYPRAYQFVRDVSPFSFFRESSPVIRIAIHVRRGELFVVESNRMLPNSYYIAVAQKIRIVLDELNLNYVFELHTEVPAKAFTVTPSHHGILNRISNSITIDPRSSRLEEFDSIPNLEKFINSDPIETIQRMASADILVMSHSSFSYLGAILNRNGIIIYHKFWHTMLKDWLRADDSGHFSKRIFLKRFKEKIGSMKS